MVGRAHPLARDPGRHRLSALRLVAALLVLVLGATLGWLGVRAVQDGSPTPVYSLAALEDDLAQAPAAWLHRPLRVRAALGGQCTAAAGQSCTSWRMALTDPQQPEGQTTGDDVQPLPLAWARPPAWLTSLRRLPLLGGWLPPAQILHSGVQAVYRVELRPTACVLGQDTDCDEVLLLDAFPPDDSTDWVRIGS